MFSATAISKQNRHSHSRRRFLAGVTTAGALSCPWNTNSLFQLEAREIDEYDKDNIKLARRVPGSINEQDMNFLLIIYNIQIYFPTSYISILNCFDDL